MQGRCVLQVESFLEASVDRHPGKLALVCGQRHLTYADIDAEANRVAHLLRAAGVARGDRVAVYLNNGVEAVVAIFAILKAGGVFLVLNPATKEKKLKYVLDNCRAAALVTDRRGHSVVESLGPHLPHLRLLLVVGAATRHERDGRTLIPFEE